MDGATVFQMVSGLGRSFGGAYSAGRAQAQEDEAPAALENLLKAQQGATLGSLGDAYAQPAPAAGSSAQPGRLPAFAGGDASMRIPAAGGPLETRFVDALKAGGLTNPAGLAAMAAYANRESGYKPSAITGSWSDPSESGQPGTSGGILSWRGDRFANMRRFTAGAEDPVVAQAKFALTENPTLTQALQNAKSAEEANSLMANAWRFAGFNRPGGEMAARLGTTKAYLARLGGVPAEATQVAQQQARPPAATAVANAAPALPSFARPGGAAMTMPDAPVQQAAAPVASEVPEADVPAATARPAGFMIPPGPAAAAPAAGPATNGFAGFASGGSRMTPELSTALTAAWRNPNTRSVATAVLNQILTGKDAAWSIADLGNGRKALFDAKSARIVPLPGTGDQYVNEVDSAGNQFNTNAATGKREVLIRAPEATSDQRNFQQVLADPRFQGYLDAQRRPLTPTMVSPGQAVLPPGEYSKPSFVAPAKEEPYTLAPGQQRMVGDKIVASAPDRDKSTEGEAKLRGEFTKQLGEFNTVQDGYRRLIAATEQREANPSSVSPASDIALIFGYMKMLDPGSVVREGEYATAQNAAGVPERVINAYNKARNGEFLTAEQRQDFIDTAGRLYGQARTQAGATEARYRGLAKDQGLDEGRVATLPDAPTAPTVGARKGGPAPDKRTEAPATSKPEVVKGGRPPNGYTWDSYIAGARKTLATRPDLRPKLEDMLAKAGIPPERLDR